jgi:hypothetical protein
LPFYDFFEKNIITALVVRTQYNTLFYNAFFLNLVPFESDPIDLTLLILLILLIVDCT